MTRTFGAGDQDANRLALVGTPDANVVEPAEVPEGDLAGFVDLVLTDPEVS